MKGGTHITEQLDPNIFQELTKINSLDKQSKKNNVQLLHAGNHMHYFIPILPARLHLTCFKNICSADRRAITCSRAWARGPGKVRYGRAALKSARQITLMEIHNAHEVGSGYDIDAFGHKRQWPKYINGKCQKCEYIF